MYGWIDFVDKFKLDGASVTSFGFALLGTVEGLPQAPEGGGGRELTNNFSNLINR